MAITKLGQVTARYISRSAVLYGKKKKKDKFPSILSDMGHEGEGSWKIYRTISFAMIGVVGCAAANVFMEHSQNHEPRAEFVPYEHLRLRHKRFAWGDGQKSFFHNKEVNPLPDGYEDD